MDPLDSLDTHCPECGVIMFDNRCRNCGHTLPLEAVERPADADNLPGIHNS